MLSCLVNRYRRCGSIASYQPFLYCKCVAISENLYVQDISSSASRRRGEVDPSNVRLISNRIGVAPMRGVSKAKTKFCVGVSAPTGCFCCGIVLLACLPILETLHSGVFVAGFAHE